jgi:copper chaperone
MSLKINVPTLADSKEAKKLTDAIATVDPTAKVDIDIESKTVTIDAPDSGKSVASEESIKQAITATGHSIEE